MAFSSAEISNIEPFLRTILSKINISGRFFGQISNVETKNIYIMESRSCYNTALLHMDLLLENI